MFIRSNTKRSPQVRRLIVLNILLWYTMPLIYIVTNNVNKKQYIGQTSTSLKCRQAQHVRLANNPKHHSHGYFQRALAKYGPDAFAWETLCEAEQSELNELEELTIEMYQTLMPRGYNMTTGGDCPIKAAAGRRKSCNEELPKYISRTDSGYIVSHYQTGKRTTFASKQQTMEQKLECAKAWLAEVERGKIMTPRKFGPCRNRVEDAHLPKGVGALRRGGVVVGYYCQYHGTDGRKCTQFVRRKCSLTTLLEEAKQWMHDMANRVPMQDRRARVIACV